LSLFCEEEKNMRLSLDDEGIAREHVWYDDAREAQKGMLVHSAMRKELQVAMTLGTCIAWEGAMPWKVSGPSPEFQDQIPGRFRKSKPSFVQASKCL
jgi:hypothetical protein